MQGMETPFIIAGKGIRQEEQENCPENFGHFFHWY